MPPRRDLGKMAKKRDLAEICAQRESEVATTHAIAKKRKPGNKAAARKSEPTPKPRQRVSQRLFGRGRATLPSNSPGDPVEIEPESSERTPSPPPSRRHALSPPPEAAEEEVIGEVEWRNSDSSDDNEGQCRRPRMLIPSTRARSTGIGARKLLHKKHKGMMGAAYRKLSQVPQNHRGPSPTTDAEFHQLLNTSPERVPHTISPHHSATARVNEPAPAPSARRTSQQEKNQSSNGVQGGQSSNPQGGQSSGGAVSRSAVHSAPPPLSAVDMPNPMDTDNGAIVEQRAAEADNDGEGLRKIRVNEKFGPGMKLMFF